MKVKNKVIILSALSGAIGSFFGAVSGSNNNFVIVGVSVLFSILAAWGIGGFLK